VALDGQSQRTGAGFVQAGWSRGSLRLDAGLRQDDNDAYGSGHHDQARSGVAGPRQPASCAPTTGKASTAPTLADLYYPGFSNPDLQPERSSSVELGLDGRRGGWSWALGGFSTDFDDLIQFDFTTFQPFNTGRARSRGLEAETAWSHDDLALSWNATLLDTEDRDTGKALLRRPRETSNLLATWRSGPWTLHAEGRYVGERFDVGDVRLPSYSTAAIAAAFRIAGNLGLEPYARIENLFDHEYDGSRGLPGARPALHPRSRAATLSARGFTRWGAAAICAAALVACTTRPAEPVTAERRIAVMAPWAAETIAALGAAGEVVGVGDFVTWPPVLAGRPKVGAYDQPNLETLLALRTNLFVSTRSRAAAAQHERLRGFGIEVVELDTATYRGTLEAITTLGARLGRAETARELVARIEQRVGDVRRRAAAAPPRRVLMAVGQEPLFVAGPGSHLDELIAVAGGENVAAGATAPWAMLSLEAAIASRPEVILDSSDNRPGAPRGRSPRLWARWPFLPAVAANRVYASTRRDSRFRARGSARWRS
jgi:ABC-type Fe3+-hydroxamate transport system substrate-binding protein